MYVRVSRFSGGSPDEIDQATVRLRDDLLPRMREIDGFKGVIAMADRTSGDQLALTFWEDQEAMRASEEAADQMRGEDLGEGEQIVGVDRYEVMAFEMG